MARCTARSSRVSRKRSTFDSSGETTSTKSFALDSGERRGARIAAVEAAAVCSKCVQFFDDNAAREAERHVECAFVGDIFLWRRPSDKSLLRVQVIVAHDDALQAELLDAGGVVDGLRIDDLFLLPRPLRQYASFAVHAKSELPPVAVERSAAMVSGELRAACGLIVARLQYDTLRAKVQELIGSGGRCRFKVIKHEDGGRLSDLFHVVWSPRPPVQNVTARVNANLAQ